MNSPKERPTGRFYIMVRRKRHSIHPLFHFMLYSRFLYQNKIEKIVKYYGYYGYCGFQKININGIKHIQTKWCAAIQFFKQIIPCLLWIMITFSYFKW